MTNFCCAFVSFSANKIHSTVTLVTSVKDALLLPTEQKGMVDYLHYIVIINMTSIYNLMKSQLLLMLVYCYTLSLDYFLAKSSNFLEATSKDCPRL